MLVTGLVIGDSIAAGEVCQLDSAAQIDRLVDGAVLVTSMTEPDWVPIRMHASAIATDHGNRTRHAAIVSRELGLTAIIGAGDATDVLEDGAEITVSCAEGDEGHVYRGRPNFEVEEIDTLQIPAPGPRRWSVSATRQRRSAGGGLAELSGRFSSPVTTLLQRNHVGLSDSAVSTLPDTRGQ